MPTKKDYEAQGELASKDAAAGAKVVSCPFKEGSWQHESWMTGWRRAHKAASAAMPADAIYHTAVRADGVREHVGTTWRHHPEGTATGRVPSSVPAKSNTPKPAPIKHHSFVWDAIEGEVKSFYCAVRVHIMNLYNSLEYEQPGTKRYFRLIAAIQRVSKRHRARIAGHPVRRLTTIAAHQPWLNGQ